MGRKKIPVFSVVATDKRNARDGRYIEDLGRYYPLEQPAEIRLDEDRVLYWLSNGAQPSDTVRSILRKRGLLLAHTMQKKGASEEEIAEAREEHLERVEARGDDIKMTAEMRQQQALEEERKRAKKLEEEARKRKEEEEKRKQEEAQAAKEAEEAEAKEAEGEEEAAEADDAEAGDADEATAEAEEATADAEADEADESAEDEAASDADEADEEAADDASGDEEDEENK
jgi:small subunit ribosomal protein S16